MSKTAIRIRVRGIELNERTFIGVLPPLAPRLGMVAWTIHPGVVTLQVDPSEPLILLEATVNRMARHLGGVAKRLGFDGYRIAVAEQRRAAA